MYASVRWYEMDDPAAVDEAMRRVEEGFVPIISKAPGFIAYYALDAGDGVVASISIFTDQAGAEESNAVAEEWVMENLASLVPNPPDITTGEVKVHKTARQEPHHALLLPHPQPRRLQPNPRTPGLHRRGAV